MQYVIMFEGNVIWGARDWNFRSMENIILEECNATVTLPVQEPSMAIIVSDKIKIYPAKLQYASRNEKTQIHSGPFWTVADNVANGSWIAADKDIDTVKATLKVQVAANRYAAETKDLALTIQGTDIIVEADRMNKMTIIVMTSAMNDTDPYNFKFPKSGNWLPMTKANMYTLIGAFLTQTQTAFDWEAAKVTEIELCETLAELDAVDVGDINV